VLFRILLSSTLVYLVQGVCARSYCSNCALRLGSSARGMAAVEDPTALVESRGQGKRSLERGGWRDQGHRLPEASRNGCGPSRLFSSTRSPVGDRLERGFKASCAWSVRTRCGTCGDDDGSRTVYPQLRLRGGSTWGSTWSSSPFGSNKKAHNPENDPEVGAEDCPNDTVTDLRFSPKALLPKNYLVATTWEGEVRCYDIDSGSGKANPVSMQRHEKPVLCCGWKSDGSAIFSGSADGKGMMWHLATNSWTQIAQHDGPISGIFYSELPSPCVITSSWDRTVKFWDVSGAPTGTPMGTLQMPDRVYAMDVVGNVMVIATAERHVLVYDLRNPSQPFRQKHSPLKYQSRCLAIFPDQTGFCIGSIEGRVAIEHIQDADLPKNFAFKCHRQNTETKDPELYAVNSLAFHPVGTFATAGGDGAFNFWDKDAKHRLKAFQRASQAVTATAFNHDGALYAYAVGYDWSKGVGSHMVLSPEQRKGRIMVHLVNQECKPKKKDDTAKRW
jgi:mRNA export factor